MNNQQWMTMIKRIVLVIALTMLPSAAMAQHHEHAKQETAKAAEQHKNFAQELIAAKAELKLTADQIVKLEAFSAKMDEHHKNMNAHHGDAKTGDAAKMESKLHSDLLEVFSEEQLVKVRPLMKAHMDKCEHMKAAKKAEPHKH
jgi:hypothetical protein